MTPQEQLAGHPLVRTTTVEDDVLWLELDVDGLEADVSCVPFREGLALNALLQTDVEPARLRGGFNAGTQLVNCRFVLRGRGLCLRMDVDPDSSLRLRLTRFARTLKGLLDGGIGLPTALNIPVAPSVFAQAGLQEAAPGIWRDEGDPAVMVVASTGLTISALLVGDAGDPDEWLGDRSIVHLLQAHAGVFDCEVVPIEGIGLMLRTLVDAELDADGLRYKIDRLRADAGDVLGALHRTVEELRDTLDRMSQFFGSLVARGAMTDEQVAVGIIMAGRGQPTNSGHEALDAALEETAELLFDDLPLYDPRLDVIWQSRAVGLVGLGHWPLQTLWDLLRDVLGD